MKTSRVTTLLLTIATTTASSQALTPSCPSTSDPLYRYKTAPGWSYLKVGGGLQSPRDLVVDGEGRLLIIEEGLGLSQHIVDANECITNSRLLISNPDLNHGICLNADEKILYANSPSSVLSWTYDPASGNVGHDQVLVVSGHGDLWPRHENIGHT